MNLKCCICGKQAIKIMEGFTLCNTNKCYVAAHLPGYALTIAIYVILAIGMLIIGLNQ